MYNKCVINAFISKYYNTKELIIAIYIIRSHTNY